MAFVSGLAVESYHIWPYRIIHDMVAVGRSLVTYGEIVSPRRIQKAPPDAPDVRVKIYDPEQMVPGFYVLYGWDQQENRYTSRLYDEKGVLHHIWPVDYAALSPDNPVHKKENAHALGVLRDGSIIVSFARGDFMARLDACGKPIWMNKGVYHHSLFKAEDGSYWTWRSPGTPFGHHHFLVNFDPESGAILKEIDLVEDIIKADALSSLVFSTRPDFKFLDLADSPCDGRETDLYHPNDIEELSSRLVEQFPMFCAGDLMISVRNLNLVCVIDPVSFHIKWWNIGPWRLQHDPDFTQDGKISVFNNNRGHLRSEILQIDPSTHETVNKLLGGEVHFYSEAMGKHQYLSNGNILIIVPDEGRMLVTSSTGKKVAEFNNIIDNQDHMTGRVVNGMWLPPDYFQNVPTCPEDFHKE